jgi:hypothetical protein
MSAVLIFNHSERPVPYNSDGQMLPAREIIEADSSDPVCALSIDEGHVAVLTPPEVVEVPNSNPTAVVSDEGATEVAEAEADEADAASEVTEGLVEAKSSTRKKSTSQASKES